jgi:hypothetical protein
VQILPARLDFGDLVSLSLGTLLFCVEDEQNVSIVDFVRDLSPALSLGVNAINSSYFDVLIHGNVLSISKYRGLNSRSEVSVIRRYDVGRSHGDEGDQASG